MNTRLDTSTIDTVRFPKSTACHEYALKTMTFVLGLAACLVPISHSHAQMHDHTFGIAGVAKLNLNEGGLDRFVDMTVASDGSIYVLGYTFAGGNQNIVVARYQPNGQLDATFGGFGPMTPGTVVVDIYGKDVPGAIRVLDDGKILVGCYVYNRGVTLLRLEEQGHHDVTFGADHSGVVHIGVPFPVDSSKRLYVRDMSIIGDNVYLLTNAGVVGCHGNGDVDGAFASAGHFMPGDVSDQLYRLHRMCVENSRLVLVGEAVEYLDDGTKNAFTQMIGLTGAGLADPGFGNGGVLDCPNFIDSSNSAIEVHDGVITAASGDRIIQMDFHGMLRSNFSNNGIAETFPYGKITDIELMTYGRIAATVKMPSPLGNDFSVVRLLPDGSLDPSFSYATFGVPEDGWFHASMGHAAEAKRLFSYANGKLLVAGDYRYNTQEGGDAAIVLMRLHETTEGTGGGNGPGDWDFPGKMTEQTTQGTNTRGNIQQLR